MDILIKSFNRPYYLDRCLFSIEKFGKNFDGSLYVLDDGTPQKYLDKIKKKYPKVKILKSEFYEEKSKLITNSEAEKISKIPIDLWFSGASIASEYFLLLEDDFWFTKEFDFTYYEKIVFLKNIALFKLFWLGNQQLISGQNCIAENEYLLYKPNLTTLNPTLFKIIFNLHRFGFNKIMRFLKLCTDEKLLKYYSIYSVAGAIFKKEYFLSLWKNHKNLVDEKLQIKNAIKYISVNNGIQFGRTNTECLATGFSSSATNKKENPIVIDIFKFNKLLNDAWLSDNFNSTKDLFKDLDEASISKILESSDKESSLSITDWKAWVLFFKNQFRAVGCIIK